MKYECLRNPCLYFDSCCVICRSYIQHNKHANCIEKRCNRHRPTSSNMINGSSSPPYKIGQLKALWMAKNVRRVRGVMKHIQYLIVWWVAINAYRKTQSPCRRGLTLSHRVQFMLIETMKREEIIKALRVYSLGMRSRNTTLKPWGAIFRLQNIVRGRTSQKFGKSSSFSYPPL